MWFLFTIHCIYPDDIIGIDRRWSCIQPSVNLTSNMGRRQHAHACIVNMYICTYSTLKILKNRESQGSGETYLDQMMGINFSQNWHLNETWNTRRSQPKFWIGSILNRKTGLYLEIHLCILKHFRSTSYSANREIFSVCLDWPDQTRLGKTQDLLIPGIWFNHFDYDVLTVSYIQILLFCSKPEINKNCKVCI